ncbi:MAG: sirohydrochlorin cobaltochelatase [Parabacteroides sp.]|nr:sirohydrochlorin cobaltochelatase [Parabacteroides sp.]
MSKLLFFILAFSLSVYGYASEEGNTVESDLFAGMKPGDKAAVLMVHFGTTYDDTRALTIDVINRKAQEVFGAQADVHEAYTSRIILKKLRAKGIAKPNPREALERLRKEGYTHVLIQSTNIIDGVETESLRRDAESMAGAFNDLRMGTPLLYSVEDYEKVTAILTSGPLSQCEGMRILVGHGTYTPSTAAYAMLDYMLKAKGHGEYIVGTIEGYPAFEDMLAQAEASGVKEVTLAPFMFVAGDHANNDIAVEWKEELEKRGYRVNVLMQGLGEYPQIQDLFIEHARFASLHKRIGIMEKKKRYARE